MQTLTPDWQNLKTGEDNTEYEIDSSEDNRNAVLAMVSSAHNSIDIFTRDLEARVYDNSAFCEALKQTALDNSRAQIRVIVQEPDHAIHHGHCMINLARRITSFMQLRVVHDDYKTDPRAFILCDERAYLVKNIASRFEARLNFNDAYATQELQNYFNEVWEHSKPHMDFQRLHI